MFDFFIDLLNQNNVKFSFGDYAGFESIVIKKNKYKIEIYYDTVDNEFVSDVQSVPYTWGKMGSTDIPGIIYDLSHYLKINISSFFQDSLFK